MFPTTMRRALLYILPFLIGGCGNHEEKIHPVRKNIIETVYASGKIMPENEYRVFALANGTVKEKLVTEGTPVAAGTVLYKISSEAPQARLDAARSSLENSQSNLSPQSRILADLKLAMEIAAAKFSLDSSNYVRTKNLFNQDATSKSTVENALTAYTISLNQKKSAEEKYYAAKNELNLALQNAKSQMASAQTEYDNYFIKSETKGFVFQLMKEAGETVRPGEMVALLGDELGRIIRLSVDQQDIDRIQTGQEVLVRSDVSGTTVFHANVSRIFPVMNEVDQTFRVDALFRDSLKQPYVHSSVEANIIIQKKDNALIIPREAMIADDSVEVMLDSKRKIIFVETGIRTLDDVEILGGIDESTEVIVPLKK
jgi:multidrug efflux pump subunit AcrA (membrane-fusion protein)